MPLSLSADLRKKNTGRINIKPLAITVQEVVVTAQKELLVTSIDRNVFNFSQNLMSQIGIAIDMKTQHVVSWYDKKTNQIIGEMNASHIDLNVLQQIFKPSLQDPLLLRSYEIDLTKSELILEWMSIPFDFEMYIYQLDCITFVD